MKVHLRAETRISRKESSALAACLEQAARRLAARRVPGARALAGAELSLVLTHNKAIRKLNKTWRRKDKATDVLSFPQWTPEELRRMQPGQPLPLGDIVISVEYARAEAERRGEKLIDELKRLLIHGFVHLLGYDHELGPREARRMRRVERYLLT